MKFTRCAGIAVLVSLIPSSALAGEGGATSPPVLATCASTDITADSATMVACEGYIAKNLLNVAHSDTDAQIVNSFGYGDWNGDIVKTISNLGGSHTLDFKIKLTGITILGVHYGGGQGGPGSESTAFYVLDAGQGVNQLHLAYNASSDAMLFTTGLMPQVSAVPEPAAWTAILCGFGLIGCALRNRRRVSAFSA